MEFIHQPSVDSRLGEYLNEGFLGPWTHFRAAIAFVKRSGTRHIEQSLAEFAQSHDVEIIAGIDHRGTSYEGLSSLLQAVSPRGRVIIFHNPTFRTFHPKVYLFKSQIAADLVVGSGNLTEGGLFANYEAGIRLRLDLANPPEAAILEGIERVLDRWRDLARGTAQVLDEALLTKLADWGLFGSETHTPSYGDEHGQSSDEASQRLTGFPFTAYAEPGTPSVPSHTQQASAPVVTRPPTPAQATAVGFVMTMERTDAGVGQSTPGTSRRSPEVFIPLAARNADPAFWGWPDLFEEDPNRIGKMDRRDVPVFFDGHTINVNMMTWPPKHDFRLRSGTIRNASNIGDILRLERPQSPEAAHAYLVEVISFGTARHQLYLAYCNQAVRNSQKRYGYY